MTPYDLKIQGAFILPGGAVIEAFGVFLADGLPLQTPSFLAQITEHGVIMNDPFLAIQFIVIFVCWLFDLIRV